LEQYKYFAFQFKAREEILLNRYCWWARSKENCKNQNTFSSLTCGTSADSFPERVYPTEAQHRNHKYYPWLF